MSLGSIHTLNWKFSSIFWTGLELGARIKNQLGGKGRNSTWHLNERRNSHLELSRCKKEALKKKKLLPPSPLLSLGSLRNHSASLGYCSLSAFSVFFRREGKAAGAADQTDRLWLGEAASQLPPSLRFASGFSASEPPPLGSAAMTSPPPPL